MKTYQGVPHGVPTTEAGTIKADLLTFLKRCIDHNRGVAALRQSH